MQCEPRLLFEEVTPRRSVELPAQCLSSLPRCRRAIAWAGDERDSHRKKKKKTSSLEFRDVPEDSATGPTTVKHPRPTP